jgi:hypothetical protein
MLLMFLIAAFNSLMICKGISRVGTSLVISDRLPVRAGMILLISVIFFTVRVPVFDISFEMLLKDVTVD